MASGFSVRDRKVDPPVTFSGIVTNTPISKTTDLGEYGTTHLRVDIQVTAVTVVGAITAKLQHQSPGGAFEDCTGANATVAITAAGNFSITQLVERAADLPNMPLRKACRVVVTTTNAGDAFTLSNVWFQGVPG